jgi:broad specificity phosphatase PhoE
MMASPCEIVLVRHGETAWNKEGRLQGQAEPGPPLDELGFQQAAVVS